MEDNYIFGNDWMDAIQFVQDVLEFYARDLEKNEPYALNTIRRLRDAAREVGYLEEYVEDILNS